MRKEHAPKISRKKEDIDFEISFYENILKSTPDFIEALSAIGDLYTRAGLWQKGLDVDIKLSHLRPEDAIVHYNLACSYALLNQTRAALGSLTKAIDFGYDDFEHLKGDTDLDNLLKTPIFSNTLNSWKKRKADQACMRCICADMKHYRQELWFHTKTRRAYINITDQVQAAIDKSGIQEGLCLVNAMHISASVYINDDESGLLQDYDAWLEKLAPHAPTAQYRHNDTGEDNADAHLKRQVMGREVIVAITAGKLDFGPWEQIFYGEFDGKRDKRVLVKIIGE